MKLFATLFTLVLLLGVSPLAAQENQAGSVAIAKNAEVTDTLPGGGVDCLEKSSKTLPAGEAAKFCLSLAKLEAKRSEKVANEAADATKASRPVVISPYSYGYRSYGWGGGGVSWGVRIGGGRSYTHRSYSRSPRHRRNNN